MIITNLPRLVCEVIIVSCPSTLWGKEAKEEKKNHNSIKLKTHLSLQLLV